MQRSVLPANIVLGILILLVTARILADVAAYRLGGLIPATPGGPADSAASRQPLPLGAYGVILEKGLFGPATRGTLTPLAQAAAQPAAAPAVAPTDLVLLGTAAGTPRQSFILVRKSSTNEERVFRIGERVFDLGTLSAVHKETADLKSGDRTITLRTPNAPQEAPRSTPATPPAGPAAAGVIPASAGSEGIIEQRALNAALDNIGQAMTDARLLPSVKDGKVEGFKLSEVRSQGVFAAIGLRNGDVLQKINDFPVDSPEKAIQSFMTLKGQTRIKLDLIRDGAPTTLSYEIR